MLEQVTEIVGYLKGIIKYKWVALITAWIFCVIGWVVVAMLPNMYTSEAKVHVETRTMLQPLLRGMTIQTDITALLRIMRVLMFTNTNIEQIINLTDIKEKIKSPEDLQAQISDLKKDIQIAGGRDEIFEIKYEAKDPNTAKNVVQAVLTVFSEQTQLSTLEGVDKAHQFIDEQIREYETRLRNAEKAMENFKRANLGLFPGQGNDNIGEIQKLKVELEAAKLELDQELSKKETLKKQLDESLASDEEWGLITDETAQTQEDMKIAELEKKKDELLIKYTRNHPEVAYIEKNLEKIKKANTEKKSKITEVGFIDSAIKSSPYLQTIKVEINSIDANIAAINSRIRSFDQQLNKSQDDLNLRLSVETEYHNLNRDYEAVKINYEHLLASRETATLSKKVDDQAEALKFKISDPPNLPLKPSSPNRILLFSIVLVVGIGIGIAVAFGIYLLRPAVMSLAQVREISGLPVLGTVSLRINPLHAKKNKKDILVFSTALIALLTVYASFIVFTFIKLRPDLLTRFV